jgi:hypothetical protein
VEAKDLVVGQVYFRLGFADEEMLVPELRPLVFVGRDLDPEDADGRLFFQDYASYARGARWGIEPPPLDGATEIERIEQFLARGWFETIQESATTGVFTFEKALDSLLSCSLRRQGRRDFDGA